MRKIKNPKRKKESRIITWEQELFHSLYKDVPASEIPEYSLTEIKNVLCYGTWGEVRPGTRLWAAANLPTLAEEAEFSAGGRPISPLPDLDGRNDYVASKTGDLITKSAGQDFTSADIGSFFVWPNGVNDLIIEVVNSDTIQVNSDTPHSAATASDPASMRGPINAIHWHDGTRQVILHIDTRVFRTDYQMRTYTQIYPRSASVPGNVKSDFDSNEGFVYLFANGVFQIDTIDWEMYKINEEVPDNDIFREDIYRAGGSGIFDFNTPIQNDEYIYGRRYIFAMSRLDGTGFRNRGTPNTAIRKETGTNKIRPEDDYIDYKEVWYRNPPFETNGNVSYLVLGDTLTAVIDDFISVVEGSFTAVVEVGGFNTSRNVVVNLGSAKTFGDVAQIMEDALKATFPDADGLPDTPPYVRFVDDHFIMSGGNYDESTITVWTAGTVGTDVATLARMTTATGAIPRGAFTNHFLGSTNESNPALKIPEGQRQWTHYSIYSTRDVADPAINDTQYIWQEDLPVAKAFIANRLNASAGPINALEGTFSRLDIGSHLKFQDGSDVFLLRYSDSNLMYTELIVGSYTPIPTQAACIGNGRLGIFSQTGTRVSREEGDKFRYEDEGKTLFWSDGTYGYIVSYVNENEVETEKEASHDNEAMTWDPKSRNYNDLVSDKILKARAESEGSNVNYFLLKQRFWTPLPDAAFGVVGPLFMYVANREGEEIYYSEGAPGLLYLLGHYDARFQHHAVKDSIMALKEFPDKIIVFCSSSTQRIQTNTTNQVINDIGTTVSVISGLKMISNTIGIKNKGSIAVMPDGNMIMITSEPAIRIFDGFRFGDNLARDEEGKGHIQNDLERYQAVAAAGYDRLYGYIMWVQDQDTDVVDFNLSWRKGIMKEQPQNWMEFDGDWVYPEPEIGAFDVFDARDRRITLVFDMYEGVPYMLTTREGSVGSNITKVFVDKLGVGYELGTEIPWALGFKEHRGKREEDLIKHLESHFHFRPQDEANQGVEGYDAQGFRAAQEIAVQIFENGSVTQTTITNNIPDKADVVFDKQVDANRVQLRLSGTASELKLVSHNTDYEDMDLRGSPAQRTMTEDTYQEALSLPTFWISRVSSLLDRASGVSPSGSIFGYTEGPDNEQNSAFVFASASNLEYSHSYSYAADFTFMFVLSNIFSSTEIFRIGSMIVRIEVSGSTYTISFNDGSNTYEQELEWNGSGWVYLKIMRDNDDLIWSENGALLSREMLSSIELITGNVEFVTRTSKRLFDMRIYDFTIIEDANNYYYRDVTEKQGLALLPI